MFRRFIASCVCLTLIVSTCVSGFAQEFNVNQLPVPGTMVWVSPSFTPALIRGLTVHKDNPFLFDFIVDPGDSVKMPNSLEDNALEQDVAAKQSFKDESLRMIKYFFAALTIPDKDIWVNLSPYEKDRMIPVSLGKTAMGRDLLAQDYMLKQLTASLINPQKSLGKIFWNKVYTKAKEMYGTTQVPVNTFNKVWIVPQKAGVYEHGQTAFIVSGHLKVMLEEDYLSMTKHTAISNPVIPAQAGPLTGHSQELGTQNKNNINALGSQVIRQIILPAIEKEINEGKNFVTLRQIFYAQVLAVWFKHNLKQALLNRVYANKSTVRGIDQNNAATNEAIYHQYLKAYKKGVFNFIKEEQDPITQETMPRKYFSGGYNSAQLTILPGKLTPASMDAAQRSVDVRVLAAANKEMSAAVDTAIDDSAMIAEAQQWFNAALPTMQQVGAWGLAVGLTAKSVLHYLGRRAKSVGAKKKIYGLLNYLVVKTPGISILPTSALLLGLSTMALATKTGVNIDAGWFASFEFLAGFTVVKGIANDRSYVNDLYEATKEGDGDEIKQLEGLQDKIWKKVFLPLDLALYAFLVYLGLYKPSFTIFPKDQLYHFLENKNIVFQYIIQFSPLVAGSVVGSFAGWRTRLLAKTTRIIAVITILVAIVTGRYNSLGALMDKHAPGFSEYMRRQSIVPNIPDGTTVVFIYPENTIDAIASHTGYPDPVKLASINGIHSIKEALPEEKQIFVPGRTHAYGRIDAAGYTPELISGYVFGDSQRYSNKFFLITDKEQIWVPPQTVFKKGDLISVWVSSQEYPAWQQRQDKTGTILHLPPVLAPKLPRLSSDHAMTPAQYIEKDVGGIDLSQQDSALHVEKDANGGVVVNVDPAAIARVQAQGLSEVDPVIINMRPADIKSLFGISMSTP